MSAPTIVPGSPFGKTPRGVYLLVGLVAGVALLAAFSAVTPWYQESSDLPGATILISINQYYTPGPGGYEYVCQSYLTANLTQCTTFGTTYNAGSGTELLQGLYLGLLAATAAVAVLTFALAVLIVSAQSGSVRVRRVRGWLVPLTIAALVIASAAALVGPGLQGTALGDFGTCAGYTSSLTPCNSVFGSASGEGCSGRSCTVTNLAWHPWVGWYLDLAAVGVLLGVLAMLWRQPIGAPCPDCGAYNRFLGKFCDTCGNRLPWNVAEKPYVLRL